MRTWPTRCGGSEQASVSSKRTAVGARITAPDRQSAPVLSAARWRVVARSLRFGEVPVGEAACELFACYGVCEIGEPDGVGRARRVVLSCGLGRGCRMWVGPSPGVVGPASRERDREHGGSSSDPERMPESKRADCRRVVWSRGVVLACLHGVLLACGARMRLQQARKHPWWHGCFVSVRVRA